MVKHNKDPSVFLGRPEIFRLKISSISTPFSHFNRNPTAGTMAAPDLELGLGSILLDLHGTGILKKNATGTVLKGYDGLGPLFGSYIYIYIVL